MGGRGGQSITGEFHKINIYRQSVRPVKAWKKLVMSIRKTKLMKKQGNLLQEKQKIS